MSSSQILVLGAIAGFTIFLGLPLGRVRNPDARLRAALSGLATGILLFLLYDVLAHGVGPVEESLEHAVAENGSWGKFAGLAGLLAAGFVLGLDEPRLLRPLDEEPAGARFRRSRRRRGRRVRGALVVRTARSPDTASRC